MDQLHLTPAGDRNDRSHAFALVLAGRSHGVTLLCGHLDGAAIGLAAPFRHGVRRAEAHGCRVVQHHIRVA